MSTEQDQQGRTLTELREMSEAEARTSLTMAEFEKWEALNDKLDEHEQRLAEWQQTREDATDVLVRMDTSDLATRTELFGNEVEVYYAPDDERVQAASERLMDLFGVDDPEAIAGDEDAASEVTADDLDGEPEEVVAGVKDALADLVLVAVQEWNGTAWEDFSDGQRDAIRDALVADPPGGWGVSGLMDAWGEIQVRVEENRDERLERVQKFRDPERRGDR